MGKFDKYNRKNFSLKGLVAICLFIGIIFLFLYTVYKRYFKAEEKKKSKKMQNENLSNEFKKSNENISSTPSESLNTKNENNFYDPSEQYTPKKLKIKIKEPKVPKALLKQIKELNKTK